MEEFPKIIEQKSKEAEQMLPILIIYRDNDLFEKWVPGVMQNLKSLGRKVEIQSFPSTTDEEQIKQWIIDNAENLHGKELLSDGTFRSVTWDKEVKQELKEELTFSKDYLDSLMSEATESVLLGMPQKSLSSLQGKLRDEIKKGEDATETEERYFASESGAIKRLIENIPADKRPIEIVIVKHIIAEHSPLRFKFVFREGRWLDKSEQDSTKKETVEKSYAEFLANAFRDSGISNVSVVELPKDLTTETIENANKRRAFVVYDRHLLMPHKSYEYTPEGRIEAVDIWGTLADKSSEIESMAALRWPLETFYEDVKEKGLVATNSNDLEKVIQEILRTKFSGK